MSYRNPTIVNDQSGAVLGQAIAQGAQNIAKGIIGMEAQNRAAKERAAKQAEKDERKAIADANAQVAVIEKNAKNSQAQYDRVQKNMKNAGEVFQDGMKKTVAKIGQLNIDFIKDKSPEKIRQIKQAKEELAGLNEFMTDFGAYLPEASKYSELAASDIVNNTSYTSINGDDGTTAKTVLNAMMAVEGYGYDLLVEDGENFLLVNGPDGMMKLSQNDLKSIGKLYNTRKESGPEEMQNATKGLVMTKTESGEEMNTSLFATDATKKGPDGRPLIEPIQKTNEVDSKGYKINRQKLDANKINQILVPEQLRVVSKIGAFRNNGERDLFLRDYRISPTVYDKATPEEQNAMIESSVKDNFLQTYNMKEEGDEYFTESSGEKVSETDTSNKKQINFNTANKEFKRAIEAGGEEKPLFRDLLTDVGSIVTSGDIYVDGKKTIRNVSTFGDNGLVVSWGKPDYPDTASKFTIKAAELVRAGKPMDIVEIDGKNRFAKDVAAKDANSISVDLSNRSQALRFMENILRVERDQAIKLYDTYYK